MKTPIWLKVEKIKITLDARPLLAGGEHPLERVMQETENFISGDIYVIITPFIPSPMIEKLNVLGFETFIRQESPSEVHTYFHKI